MARCRVQRHGQRDELGGRPRIHGAAAGLADRDHQLRDERRLPGQSLSPSRTTNPAGAALVSGIEPQATVIDLVNLGPEHSRTVSARRHSAAFTAAFTAGSRRRLFILARAVGRAMLGRSHGKIILPVDEGRLGR